MTRILVVEECAQPRVSQLVAAEGFTVFTAVDRAEGLETLDTCQPELVLLEVSTPDARVLETASALRAATVSPIVMLSGPCSEREAVAAFAAGVDSLILGPTGPHELIARVRALLRRLPPQPEELPDTLVIGPVVLDRWRRELRVNGSLVPLPRREFDIAELLMREGGRVVPRAVIVRALWGSTRDTKSLDVQVGRLRARLAAIEGRRRIVTVRGVGFRFVPDAELEALAPGREPVDGALPETPAAEIDIQALDLVVGTSEERLEESTPA
jgi:two-component system, OmpR family, response regulator RegX3